VLVLSLHAGCTKAPQSNERFVPNDGAARPALKAALEAWRQEKPTGRLAETSPPVQVVDTHRKPGQRLVEYQILGQSAQENARYYTVRLTLDAPPESQLARYLVFGIDPLWVFRFEDYEMISHWEHHMEEGKSDGSPAAETTKPPRS
jgi:hypothetical protein